MTTLTRLQSLALKDATILTLATGVITATQQFHKIASESGSSDDLVTINLGWQTTTVNSIDYRPILYLSADAGDTITIKHGTGNITLPSDTDVSITDGEFYILIYDGTNWLGIAGGGGGGGGAPTDATYITQTANGSLSNEQALGALSTGVMYSTTTTGVVSTIKLNSGQQAPCGRLTLSSSLAITTADVTSATTLYYLPYLGDTVWLYNGTNWLPFTLGSSGVNISIPASANTNYDIFIYDSSGLTLEAVAWTNATTRATAVVAQDGWRVKSGATERLYLGTIRTTTSSGECEDSVTKRYVDNAYNQVPRKIKVIESTNSWSFTTATTWRQARGSSDNQFDFVAGLTGKVIDAQVTASMNSASNYLSVGIGLDSTSVNSADTFATTGTGSALVSQTTARGIFYPAIGHHYLAWLEYVITTAAITIYGDNGATDRQSGMTGIIWG